MDPQYLVSITDPMHSGYVFELTTTGKTFVSSDWTDTVICTPEQIWSITFWQQRARHLLRSATCLSQGNMASVAAVFSHCRCQPGEEPPPAFVKDRGPVPVSGANTFCSPRVSTRLAFKEYVKKEEKHDDRSCKWLS
jgi:hypothetical protein